MKPIERRLAALEALQARRPQPQPRTFVVMPWDLIPDASPADMVIEVNFVRPTGQFGGERMPYERVGIHPADDGPRSRNVALRRGSALNAGRADA
jgi:hypothetical protein